MERSGVYRRALAPMASVAGVIGVFAGVVTDWVPGIDSSRAYVGFWVLVSFLAGGAGLYLSRQQAWRDKEPFWSPAARRVIQAFMPAVVMGIFVAVWAWNAGRVAQHWIIWTPCMWMGVYGMGLHAAGFFMPRGIRLLGWLFISGAILLGGWNLIWPIPHELTSLEWRRLNWIMAGAFGGGHLIYGIYLNLTETYRSNHEP